MADVNVKIVVNQAGTGFTYKPESFLVFKGQTVAFHCPTSLNTDAVVCFQDENLFGSKAFVLPNGRKLTLVVQDYAPDGGSPCKIAYGTLGTNLTLENADALAGPFDTSIGAEVNPPNGTG